MARIWSDEGKLETWLEVELAALAGWVEVGGEGVEDQAHLVLDADPAPPLVAAAELSPLGAVLADEVGSGRVDRAASESVTCSRVTGTAT